MEEEKEKLEKEIEELGLEGIDQEGIKMFIDALDEIMENGANEQKKHLIQVLVEKVLVHDKDRYECWFRLPDGELFEQPLKDARNDEANPLSVSHLAEQVCNHIQEAPRMCLITNQQKAEAVFVSNLVTNRKTRKYEFKRDQLKIFLRLPSKKLSHELGVITNDASHFLCPDQPVWLPSQRYPISLQQKRARRMELAIEWKRGLETGVYINYADIARKNDCSRAWVSRILNQIQIGF